MAINIKDTQADRLARQIAARTGETLTEVVTQALKERLARLEHARAPSLKTELAAIRRRCSKLTVRDARSAEQIVGYDEHGLPT